MANYKTPGVYVEEISTFPPSVAQVETAIPAFIGYTEKVSKEPTRISSMLDYRNIFGGPNPNEIGLFNISGTGEITPPTIDKTPAYKLFYMLQMFFANGGGDCFIISVGNYTDPVKNDEMEKGLELLNKEDLPTLILFPDADSSKSNDNAVDIYKAALNQCATRKDRFLICDVKQSDEAINTVSKSAEEFREAIGTNDLKFGAAYFPSLQTTIKHSYNEENVKVKLVGNTKITVLRHSEEAILEDANNIDASLYHAKNGEYKNHYFDIKNAIDAVTLLLPPSAAMAGIYARVDSTRGVWKAPANVSLNRVIAPTLKIDENEQADLNVSSSGKSINAIRSFRGKGVLVWGARTMDGNDNEWRYISVRRFFNMLEESVRNASERFVFESNDANTWVKVKAMIENYLITLWRAGAMTGMKPENAFFVNIGLGQTMSSQDVLEGRMIVEIGIAAVRPAEFIILRFSHKMMKA